MVLLLPSIRPSTLDRYGVDARLLCLTILTFFEILWMFGLRIAMELQWWLSLPVFGQCLSLSSKFISNLECVRSSSTRIGRLHEFKLRRLFMLH